ncbi:MAG: cupin domain-containing protein [Coriobacteriia bacterium]|nr:cupin domain-containing protein [Coriobacteriia bacterium]
MTTQFKDIGLRIKGLRESCDISLEEMATDLGIDPDTYAAYEETGKDVPISAVFHMASKFGVDLTEILTGIPARLDTFQVVKAGTGRTVDRYPGYNYEDLAWGFNHKIMQPLLVTLDPSDEPAELVTHRGQEFNIVLQGRIVVTFEDRELVLEQGDSIYFNPNHPHGQKCVGDEPAQFVTVIVE